ncbi:hypothetical protein ACEWY4_009941 [Coilia grayii]|uniref:Uncharacterized protein n=1 Tax=Coilia grayii TaxID=363190 RepID=A0ABD1K7Z8_9TELE
MPVPQADQENLRRQNILNASAEIEGEHFNLGKKISIPRDVMMEELKLRSNRGSRMFQERLKRVERFTLENANTGTCRPEQDGTQGRRGQLGNQENSGQADPCQAEEGGHGKGKPRKGNPGALAPGYSGPLTEVPHERFNITIIPKSYCSPWHKLSDGDTVVASISANLPDPPFKLTPTNYKCFNRAPTPFEGSAGGLRTLPLPWFELNQAYTNPMTWERMCARPNFNRAPRGWNAPHYNITVESSDL